MTATSLSLANHCAMAVAVAVAVLLGVVPPGVHPSADGSEVTSPVSLAEWFTNYYPMLADLPTPPVEILVRSFLNLLLFVTAARAHPTSHPTSHAHACTSLELWVRPAGGFKRKSTHEE